MLPKRAIGAAAAAAVLLFAALPATGQTISAYRYIVLSGTSLKWGAPVPGTAAAVTYAVVTAPHRFAGARNCPDITRLDETLAANRVARAAFDRELKAAFDAWSEVADIVFAPADPKTADILIGAQVRPRGRAFTNVEYEPAPAGAGIRPLDRAVICLNPEHGWKVGFGGDPRAYDLRYTLMHEIGHAIGLDHPVADGQVMGFRYAEAFRTLQRGDAEGARRLYGPADDVADAALPAGSGAVPSLAIDQPDRLR